MLCDDHMTSSEVEIRKKESTLYVGIDNNIAELGRNNVLSLDQAHAHDKTLISFD
jgi:hypothetical protein